MWLIRNYPAKKFALVDSATDSLIIRAGMLRLNEEAGLPDHVTRGFFHDAQAERWSSKLMKMGWSMALQSK